MKKATFMLLGLTLMSSPAWANLPNSRAFSYVQQDANGTECKLDVINGSGGQSTFRLALVVDSPRFVIDPSENNTATLLQQGPNQTVLSDQEGNWYFLTYASPDSNQTLKQLQIKDSSGNTLASCQNLSLIVFD